MKSIYVSAGHSDTDPGAVAFKRREADIARETRNMVAFYLQRAGVVHELDGTATQNLPLVTAAARAKRHPLAVEFHCNAAANALATGTETLSGPADMALGSRICDAISTSLGIKSRGAKPENAGHHSKLAFVQAGGIIVELFFITNADDLAKYDARKWLMAKAIADVLIEASAQ